METNNQSYKRTILVIRFTALGDVAMVIPVLYPVCRANPDVRFVMLTQEWPATMMINAPENLVVRGINVREKHMGLRAMWRLASDLHREFHFDAVADLHGVLRSWTMDLRLQLKGVKVARINKHRALRRQLLKHRDDTIVPTTATRYRDVFAALGLNLPAPNEFTTITDGMSEPLESALAPEKGREERWIAVSAFSSHAVKEYPFDKLTTVIAALASKPNYRVFLLGGGKQEKIKLRPLGKNIDHVVSLAEIRHGFLDEFAVLSRCDAMISMDSANMHLASLVGLPVVSIWGTTTPACGFLGYGQSIDNAVGRDDVDCRPCSIYGENKCRYGDKHCLDIEPDVIIERVVKLVEKK